MNRLDQLIDEALGAEDRALMEKIAEPGFVRQALGLLGGPGAWVNWVLVAVQSVMFLAAVWAGLRFYAATETLAAVKWGLSGAVLALLATHLKMSMMPQLQAERVLRELRRLELRLVAGRSAGEAGRKNQGT